MMKLSKPIYRLRSDAKALARDKGMARNQALDIIVQSEGFNGWSHMTFEWDKAAISPCYDFVENERDELRDREAISWPEPSYLGGHAPCPFCGETEALSMSEIEALSTEAAPWKWSIHCDNCGAKSPDAQSEGEAYRAWEIRTKSRDLNACPFCSEIADVTHNTSEVHCRKCGADGPRVSLVEDDDDFPEKDAVSLWRLRRPTSG